MPHTAGERGARPEAATPGAGTKRRILVTALECFTEQGYAGTSIRDIAERMGLTKAALYYHFTSKEEILEALTEPMFDEVRRLSDEATAGAPADRVLGGLVDILSRRAALIRTVMADPSVSHRSRRPAALDHLRAIAAAITPDRSPAAMLRARAALGAAQFATFSTAMQRAPAEPRDAAALLSGTEHLLATEERAEIVAAALRALG